MDKLITFAVPCYNSEAYMERCLSSLLAAGDDTEILIIDDGSKDRTGEIADSYAERYPDLVRVIHQENGGHGEGVNQGIRHGRGMYYKVVDSDDRLDPEALDKLLARIRENVANGTLVDMYITNYVYDHADGSPDLVMCYHRIFPQERVCTWDDTKRFSINKYLMMHSVVYRTELLREIGLELPKHTFYVDNLYMYAPFPYVKSIYYMDLNLYYYFVGREDQSVNEKNIIKRIDQQLLVTTLMTDIYDLNEIKKQSLPLYRYMFHELAMMYTITTIFQYASKQEENVQKNREMWRHLKEKDKKIYFKMRNTTLNALTRMPGKLGRAATVEIYRFINKIFKYN
ncbi:MAG: glycosyltransferase [Clostridia bacterium]|nr:glycosyltransferase [Clostridia bacterium]